VIGGLASVAGGGKFANGAITAAYGYLFNAAGIGHNGGPPLDDDLETIGRFLGLLRATPLGAFLTVALWPSPIADGTVDGAAMAELAAMRSDLEMGSSGTLARLDVGGQSYYGINAHGQEIDFQVNAISRTHAEADAFQQAKDAGVYGGNGTLYVDRPLCDACGIYGGVRSMMRQLGLDSLRVVTPAGVQFIRP
jgi:hypothetical protein